MIRKHLTYAVRHLTKNTLYTTLNVFGLSVGLACFALIGFWVKSELGYDRFHEKSDRIYRVVSRFTDQTTIIDQAVTSAPLGPALVKDIPDVEQMVRIDPSDAVMAVHDKSFLERGIITDQSFLEMFDFKLQAGDRNSALKEPYSVILSQSLAEKYFGTKDPVGQQAKIFSFDPDGNGAQYKVTGVIEDCPGNSHIFYDYVISFNTWETYDPDVLKHDMWFKHGRIYTYISLHPSSDPSTVQSTIPTLVETYMGKEMRENKFSYEYTLQALTDVHLNSNLSYEIGPNGSRTYVIIFGTVGIIVLLLACINYVNMSTAYATERFKEVGIHRVMGAMKRQLVAQYLTESWLLAVISLLIAFGWIELSRPLFESISGTKFMGMYSTQSMAILFAIASFTGLSAGLYPAVVLSHLKPVSILKGHIAGMSGTMLRKVLVVVQFSITIILVIGIVVVQMQMNFIHSKDLGFDKNKLVVFGVHGSPEVLNGYKGFADELTSSPNIGGVTRSNTTIGGGLGNLSAVVEDVYNQKVNTTIYGFGVDHDYIDVYNMKLIAGRNFRIDNAADSTRAFIVNEALTKNYGYSNPADIIGKTLELDGTVGEIIGVVKDFNFNSLLHKVEPACIHLLKFGFSRVSIRINGDTHEGFDEVQRIWKKHFPTAVLQYAFYEDTLARLYRAESRFSEIFLAFSIVSLVIACLGLFALVSYAVERRSKEIGIRKVLGASVTNILSMISAEFIWLIAISCLVAIPIGYYFMNEWLTSFAYRISLNVFMFVGAGALVLITACLTISVRTFRAASDSPAKSLRSE
jgi:putative ABC transport system permease protein